MRYGYIYMTENLINHKCYIGKKSSPEPDMSYLGSGKILKRAIQKYGKENFSVKILKWCENEEDLNSSERYFIKLYNAQKSNDFYNISEGGDWGNVTRGMSLEQYDQWKRKINPTGRHHSEETKKKMSDSRKGIVYSEDTIEKMRRANSGKNNPNYGKKQTQKHREAMKKFRKRVCVVLPNDKKINFDSVEECKKYMKSNYNFSEFLVKRLLHDNTPLMLPESEKYIYPYIYKMNGTRIVYIGGD